MCIAFIAKSDVTYHNLCSDMVIVCKSFLWYWNIFSNIHQKCNFYLNCTAEIQLWTWREALQTYLCICSTFLKTVRVFMFAWECLSHLKAHDEVCEVEFGLQIQLNGHIFNSWCHLDPSTLTWESLYHNKAYTAQQTLSKIMWGRAILYWISWQFKAEEQN